MARRCIWCGDPLPAQEQKGHRRREFCKPPKRCRQKHHLWHKAIQKKVDAQLDPSWHAAYNVLQAQYQWLESRFQEQAEELTRQRALADTFEELLRYSQDRYEALHVDYVARLKALGMSAKDIEEFNAYWREQS